MALPAGGAPAPHHPDARRRAAAVAPYLLVAAALLLFLAGLGRVPLFEPDEGRYTEIPREMLATGDFVTPRLDGVLYFEKPPLSYWAVAASMAALGNDELASRLPSALFGLAGLGLAYLLGRAMGGRRTGTWSAVVLATSPLYLAMAHSDTPDMPVSFFLGATLVCFWLAQREPGGRREGLLWYGAFASAALAVLAKGLIGIVLPGTIVLAWMLSTRSFAALRRVPWWSGGLLFLALALPWHVAMALRHPDFLWFYLVHEHFLRYATLSAERWEPVWFFLPVVLVGFLPWTGLLPAAATLVHRRDRREPRWWDPRTWAPDLLFLGLWAGIVVGFFSLSRSKLVPYVLPAFLPLAVAAARGLIAAEEASPRAAAWLRRGALPAALALVVLTLALVAASLGWIPGLAATASPAPALFAVPAAAAALVATVRLVRGRLSGAPLLAVAAALFFACVWTAAPAVAAQRSTRSLAAFLRPRLVPGARVMAFGTYPQTLPVYLDREIGLAAYHGELGFGIARLPPAERRRRFPTAEELAAEAHRGGDLYLVTEASQLPRLRELGLDPGPVLFRQGPLVLVASGDGGGSVR